MKRFGIVRATCPDCKYEFNVRKDDYDLMGEVKSWLSLSCPQSDHHYEMQLRKNVDAVPIETRQKILDIMRAGKTVGDARRTVNLDLSVVAQIISDNIEHVGFLRTEAK